MAGPSFLLQCSEPVSFTVSVMSTEHLMLYQALLTFNHHTKPMSGHNYYHHFTDALS